jgi:hypothetical protein
MRVVLRPHPANGLILFLILLLPVQPLGAEDELSPSLRNLLHDSLVAKRELHGETLHNLPLLQRFYQIREYRPAWLDHGGPTGLALALKQTLLGSREQGLEPTNYHLPAILELLGRFEQGPKASSSDRLAVELLLTDAYLLLANDYLNGRLRDEDHRG